MELKRVVVTGLGAVTPVGKSVEETWANLLAGKSGCAPITLFDASKFKTQIACEVKDFDPLQYFEKKEVRKVDRYTQFAFAAADEAIKDCGIDLETEDKNRIGVIYSSGIGGIKTFHEETMGYDPEVGPRYNPFFIPKMISDIAAGQLSIRYGFHGPNYGTVSACASSTHGMIDAFNLLRLGKANIMVVGGAEAAVAEPGVGGFNAMKALSTRNDDPEHASRPFSASRDGFVIGFPIEASILSAARVSFPIEASILSAARVSFPIEASILSAVRVPFPIEASILSAVRVLFPIEASTLSAARVSFPIEASTLSAVRMH